MCFIFVHAASVRIKLMMMIAIVLLHNISILPVLRCRGRGRSLASSPDGDDEDESEEEDEDDDGADRCDDPEQVDAELVELRLHHGRIAGVVAMQRGDGRPRRRQTLDHVRRVRRRYVTLTHAASNRSIPHFYTASGWLGSLSGQRAGLRRRRAWVQIAVATLSSNSLRQTVHTHRASVHQAAKY